MNLKIGSEVLVPSEFSEVVVVVVSGSAFCFVLRSSLEAFLGIIVGESVFLGVEVVVVVVEFDEVTKGDGGTDFPLLDNDFGLLRVGVALGDPEESEEEPVGTRS